MMPGRKPAAPSASSCRSRPAAAPTSWHHIGLEHFRQLSKIDVTYVPSPGGAPAMTALLGGHVQAVLTTYSEAVEQIHAGTVRALASASLKRIPPLPDVPTVHELGYK